MAIALLLMVVTTAGCADSDEADVAAGESTTTSSAHPGAYTTGSSTPSIGDSSPPGPTSPPTSGRPGTTTSAAQSNTSQPSATAATTAGPTTSSPPAGGPSGSPGLPPEAPPPGTVRVGGSQAATGLVANPRCDPADLARPLVTFSWRPTGSGEQRVVVSTRQDGLDSGNFASSEPLPADGATYELRDSQPGGVYYWRVLTRVTDGWMASETGQFEGAACARF